MHLLSGNLSPEQVMAPLNGPCEQLNSAQSATLSVGADSHYCLLSVTAGLFFFINKPLYPSLSLLKTTEQKMN